MATNAATDQYRQTVREISDRLVAAQKPIRILDAIKWDESVQQAFFAADCREQPPVDRAYYEARPLGFDAFDKRQEFDAIIRDINRQLGQYSGVGQIMVRMCREYQTVVRMLEARGTREFSNLSAELYGSANDAFHAHEPTLADLGDMMSEALANIDQSALITEDEKNITGEEAVRILQAKINEVFPEADSEVRVIIDDGIVADAAAGSDYIKIRKEAKFTQRELNLLMIHEGLVHVATTLNGLRQPVCTFLSKGPPSSTITQEGLAVFMESVAFASYPDRLRRVTNRIRGVAMAENDATFLDVFEFYRGQNFSPADSYSSTTRVFRGSVPNGGPFTKDLSYSKGFVLVYNFMRLAIVKGMLNRIPLLFCGKTRLDEMRVLAHLADEGLIESPKFLPPQIRDMKALIAWMCYSNFMSRMTHERVEMDYAHIL